jgi:type I restriction enzyme S subunit
MKAVDGWTSVKLGDLGGGERPAIKAGPFGSSLKKNVYTKSGYKVYGQEQVIAGDAHAGNYYISQMTFEALRSCEVRAGDILLSVMGTIGKVLVIPHNAEPGIINPRLLRLSFDKSAVFPLFMKCVLESPGISRALARRSQGATMDGLNAGVLAALPVRLPSVLEQEKIAAIVAEWDCSSEALSTLLALKAERKRGLMQQLLTGKTRFKEFEGERWRRVGLGELVQEVDRYVTFDDEHTYRLASIRRRSEGLFFREALQGKDIKTKVMKTIRAGDFLLSKMQVVHGAWGLVTPEFDGMFVSDSYISLVPTNGSALKIEFLNYLSQMRFMRHLAYICSHGVHIEKMTFNLGDFLGEKITIPPTLEEQTRIVGVLSACDREIGLLQKQLVALKEQKRGLMQKLLTGEVRVKV